MVIGTVAFGSATPVKQAGLFSFEAFGLNIPEMLERTLSLQSNAQRYLRRAIQHASNTEVRMYADEAFLRSQRASEAAKLALDQAIKDNAIPNDQPLWDTSPNNPKRAGTLRVWRMS
eukprot:1600984-Amphidinium_carterae.1